jgi:hypothetical protein
LDGRSSSTRSLTIEAADPRGRERRTG